PAPDDRPDSQPIEPPPPLRLPTLADVPRKPPTLPPPQPPAPPPRATPAPRGSQPGMQPPQRPSQRPSQPPPIGRKTPVAGEKPIPDKAPEKRTIAHAIPPMPNRAETEDDDKRPTGVRDVVENPVTAVEIDAEAKAAHIAKQQLAARQAALVAAKQQMLAKQHAAETAQMIEGSDTGVELAPPTAPPSDRTDQMELEAAIAVRPATATEQVQLPLSTAPASLPPPKKTETAISGPTPACPQCEAPMAWVEEHLRFYCKQCKMYF
ncbi:MAG: hypothetical protein ACM31C_13185, partial [Acidobacteriota bacterium]